MNAATHTYLNIFDYGGPGTPIVCSVGNDLRGNGIVSCRAHRKAPLTRTSTVKLQKHGVTLQNFGTTGFAAVDVNRAITNSIAP